MEIKFKILIDDRIVALSKKIFTTKTLIFLVVVCLFTAGLFVFSEQITKPHTFVSGSTISSTDVNENFDILFTAFNQLDQEHSGGLVIKKGRADLSGPLTLHNQTITLFYNIPVELPENTKGVFIGLRYLHASQTANTHGYLSFWAYQQNASASDDKTLFESIHYDDYYNSDYYELLVPWNNTGSGNALIVDVISSYNSSTDNTYRIYYAGYMAGN